MIRYRMLLATAALWLATGCSMLGMDGIDIEGDTIGGVVTGKNGPEAGVWVIAETKDLPNRLVKIVVTDDQGRYVLPELPKAKYSVWVRGYGLVDSAPITVEPGNRADLSAEVAPDDKAAARYYPASYWYSMLNPPGDHEFTGVGLSARGIPAAMMTGQHFLEQLKEKCLFCHQVGSETTRAPAPENNTVADWEIRMQRWPAMHNEARRLGDRGLRMLSEWSADIAAGKLPATRPERPKGVERNVVITVMGWGTGVKLHDQTSSDRLAPATNAGGSIFGMNTTEGLFHFLDPKTLKTTTMPVPGVDGSKPSAPETGLHASEMDDKGRVWVASVGKSDVPAPAWCSDGSTPSSAYFPLKGKQYAKAMPLPYYDPRTKKVVNLGVCIGGNHGHFSMDQDKKFFLTHDTSVISWINTRVFDRTGDLSKAFNWCPMVLDTSGDGRIDPDRRNWVEPPEDALEGVQGEYGGGVTAEQLRELMAVKAVPGKDLRISRYLYGIGVDPRGEVWAAAYVPYVPSGVVHLIPGDNPPLTCKTEYFEPPMKDGQYVAVGARGVGSDWQGRAWVAFSSGQIGLFDRRKCKVLNGPTATGQHCPEGWTIYDLPVPKVAKTSVTGDMAYSEWPDLFDVMGLGKDTHFFPLVNSDAIVAMRDGQSDFITFRVPYPRGFYTRGMDFRLEKPDAGWKGRAFYATQASFVLHHQEGGMDDPGAQEYKFQIRPDPLAH